MDAFLPSAALGIIERARLREEVALAQAQQGTRAAGLGATARRRGSLSGRTVSHAASLETEKAAAARMMLAFADDQWP
jgi:hypothetical protein